MNQQAVDTLHAQIDALRAEKDELDATLRYALDYIQQMPFANRQQQRVIATIEGVLK